VFALPSPIQAVVFRDQPVFVKRDDLLHPWLNGNKARKLQAYLQHDFPGVDTLVSYGGNQSNAMLALAGLARLRGWRFLYYGKPLPRTLQTHPSGNLQAALAQGMTYIAVQTFDFTNFPGNVLYVPQGGASRWAEPGIAVLAQEIQEFARLMRLAELGVIVASGTGTTAFFLHRHLKASGIHVFTVPCVGDSAYLRQQFSQLAETSGEHPKQAAYPHLLESEKTYHFGHLYAEFWHLWQALKAQTGIEFDLLYDPLAWQVLLQQRHILPAHLLYLHCGGISGNESMLKRYARFCTMLSS